MFYVFVKFQIGKSLWTDGFLKDHIRFFSFKNRERVKMHSIIKKKNTISLWNWSKSPNFYWKTQKNATSKNDLKKSNRALNQELWVFYVFAIFQIGNHNGLMDSWKTLIIFFFQKPRKSKNAVYYQKNQRFLCEIDQKVSIFVEKLKKIQPLKMTFRSQLEPPIKIYECFMFLLTFRLKTTLDWWILERR